MQLLTVFTKSAANRCQRVKIIGIKQHHYDCIFQIHLKYLYKYTFFSKEYLEFGDILTIDDLQQLYLDYRKKLRPVGKIFLFLDEIQLIDGWDAIA